MPWDRQGSRTLCLSGERTAHFIPFVYFHSPHLYIGSLVQVRLPAAPVSQLLALNRRRWPMIILPQTELW